MEEMKLKNEINVQRKGTAMKKIKMSIEGMHKSVSQACALE